MVFGSSELPEHDISDDRIAQALVDIKRQARDRRIAMVAPFALVAAVLVAFVAAPPQHGGLNLVPEADASDETALPRVFGSNGVWRFAEPIGEAQPSVPGPAWMVAVPDEPTTPEFVLVAPEDEPETSTDESLPVSASSPPTPTLGQNDDGDVDWTEFRPEVRVEPIPEPAVPAEPEVSADVPAEPEPEVAEPSDVDTSSTTDLAALAVDGEQQMSPESSVPAEAPTTPESSSTDEDVTAAETQPALTGDDDPQALVADGSIDEAGNPTEANPSLPQSDSPEAEAPDDDIVDAPATIVFESALVHSAHVSVTVVVVDDDSSVIDWCNTWIDWGDGSVTGLVDPGGEAACAAPCEREASPPAIGLSESLTFTHEYGFVIDAAPRVYVSTGDGCTFRVADLQLNPFTVVPY